MHQNAREPSWGRGLGRKALIRYRLRAAMPGGVVAVAGMTVTAMSAEAESTYASSPEFLGDAEGVDGAAATESAVFVSVE